MMKKLFVLAVVLLGSVAAFGQRHPLKNPVGSKVWVDILDNDQNDNKTAAVMIGARFRLSSGDTIGYHLNGANKEIYAVWDGQDIKVRKRRPFVIGVDRDDVQDIVQQVCHAELFV